MEIPVFSKQAIGGRWPKGRRETQRCDVTEARGRKWVYRRGSTWQLLSGGQARRGQNTSLNLVCGNVAKSSFDCSVGNRVQIKRV